MKDLKKKVKGITLIALVVTIIVLLILAGVAISLTVGNNGLFKRAKDAVNTWEKAEQNELDEMNNFINTFDKLVNNGEYGGITGSEKENTHVKDKMGNKIVIPAGFKVINPQEDVTKGIVIEDVSAKDSTSKGNQYVWIPVTHVNGEKINTIKDSNNIEHTIELARYTFNEDGTINEKVIDGSSISSYYLEETQEEHKVSGYTNTIAKDINKFKESVKNNGGYYLARYEAGDSTTNTYRTSNSSQTIPPVFKSNQIVYNNITQENAAMLVRNLYSNQTQNYESDLVNSYAWDTAIVFIQEFSGDTDYSMQSRLQDTIAKTGEASDGISKDVRCNIYDMAGNVVELTTESNSYDGSPCVGSRRYYHDNDMYSRINRAGDDAAGLTNNIGYRRNFIYVEMKI